MLTDDLIQNLIAIVREASRREILPRFRSLAPGDIATKSGPDDLVTIADREAEAYITAQVHALLPQAVVIGEEAVADDPSRLDRLNTADVAVIIDPVDGTNNFAKGLAVFGVILAVVMQGRTEFGLLYDPIMDDWIMARRGQGVVYQRADGSKTRLAPPAAPRSVGAAEGYIALFMLPDTIQHDVAAAYPAFARVQSLRCSCHEYRMLAQGHAAFFLNGGDRPWDHAAGALVLEELGGGVFDADGAPYDPVGSTAPLWAFNFTDPAMRAQIKAALGGGRRPV